VLGQAHQHDRVMLNLFFKIDHGKYWSFSYEYHWPWYGSVHTIYVVISTTVCGLSMIGQICAGALLFTTARKHYYMYIWTTVRVKNSTNITKTNNHLWPQHVEHKNTTTYDFGNPRTGSGQAQTCDGVKPIIEIPLLDKCLL
jgi:hypothetical protein